MAKIPPCVCILVPNTCSCQVEYHLCRPARPNTVAARRGAHIYRQPQSSRLRLTCPAVGPSAVPSLLRSDEPFYKLDESLDLRDRLNSRTWVFVLPTSRTSPKSPIFARKLKSSKILAVLISRWIRFFSCKYACRSAIT
jgi:hypothetical protein